MAKAGKPPVIDGSTLAFAAAALTGGILIAWFHGSEAVERALGNAAVSMLQVLTPICGGLLVAGLVQVLVPREVISRWLGRESGMRGLYIAQVAGAFTPGGPFGSFAVVYALGKVGADIGVLVTYLTSWTTLSLMRMVVWEIPFLGVKFALLRFAICLPMGIIAGVLARRLAQRLGWTTTSDIVK